MELGGNIELVGFSDSDTNDLVIIKKVVGQFTKRMSERLKDFEKLVLTRKSVNTTKTEIHGRLFFSGKEVDTKQTDYNLYFALDNTLRSLEDQAEKP